MNKPALTLAALLAAAAHFAVEESDHRDPGLYGVTDGKALGTHLEHRFRHFLQDRFAFQAGNSAKGIDFPELDVDMKVTDIHKPQSSCPFRSARQKIWGLGYSLLIFVYDKADDAATQTGRMNIIHVVYVDQTCTADYQTTTGIRRILENNGNQDDLVAFMEERLLPVDAIEADQIAEELLAQPPAVGYLTISNALQWRLKYSRVIEQAGNVAGIQRVR
jgi:hypothetical protein